MTGACPEVRSAGAFREAAEVVIRWQSGEDEGKGLERFAQCLLQSAQGGAHGSHGAQQSDLPELTQLQQAHINQK